MPTENRSSNTVMVNVPQSLIERLERFSEGSTQARPVRMDTLEHLYALCGQPALQPHPEPASYPPCDYCGTVPSYHPWHGSGMINGVENRHIHACDGCRWQLPSYAGQPHPDPIAWMVGTAFWWTKEEAERDAAETGLPIVGLGPMTESADIDQLQLEIAELQLALTMHDDAAIQDECIRAENSELHAKLAERSAPIIPELTSDLREILGRPNFTCHHVAKALRVMGITIASKSEDEQAVVIHWLLGHYLKHGADWRQRATADLEAASETMKA